LVFRIGEFAQIAQVSVRLLRYYEEIGLIAPSHTDARTGYRHYSAAQLPKLNRILALKALGFSLEQIAKALDDEVSAHELRGMLALRKAQSELALDEERMRLRQIESRLIQIETEGELKDYDVITKSVAARPFLSARVQCEGMEEAIMRLRNVVKAGVMHIKAPPREQFVVVSHSGFEDDRLDLEIGFTLTRPSNRYLDIGEGLKLMPGELPAVEHMATLVRAGPNYQAHLSFGALGVWMETNGFEITGPCREVFLDIPFRDPGTEVSVMEIQFPIQKAA
jgi:DNA-binding transcriptional MerR regulator